MNDALKSKKPSQKKYFTEKTLFNFFLFCFVISLIQCSNSNNNSAFSSEGMQLIDLSSYGKPFSIFVPDTTTLPLSIEEMNNGALEIRVGKSFAISINEQSADIALKKEDLKSDEVNKLKKLLIDTPDAIMWQSEITKPEVHFLLNKKIANSEYSFEDVVNADSKLYREDEIQKMFEACNNVKASK